MDKMTVPPWREPKSRPLWINSRGASLTRVVLKRWVFPDAVRANLQHAIARTLNCPYCALYASCGILSVKIVSKWQFMELGTLQIRMAEWAAKRFVGAHKA